MVKQVVSGPLETKYCLFVKYLRGALMGCYLRGFFSRGNKHSGLAQFFAPALLVDRRKRFPTKDQKKEDIAQK